jgi:hypothetical protein
MTKRNWDWVDESVNDQGTTTIIPAKPFLGHRVILSPDVPADTVALVDERRLVDALGLNYLPSTLTLEWERSKPTAAAFATHVRAMQEDFRLNLERYFFETPREL